MIQIPGQYQSFQQVQQQIVAAPFGLMIPGQLAVTQFEVHGNMLVHTLQMPAQVHSIGFFLFQAIDINSAACLYFSAPPYQGLQFLGAIADSRPSDIFPTNFALNPEVNIALEVKLVVQIQPVDEQLKQLVTLTSQNENQIKYAMAVAQNLYNYMSAFNKEVFYNGQNQEMLVLPTNILDKWIQRFQEKYKIDPNFIYKTTK